MIGIADVKRSLGRSPKMDQQGRVFLPMALKARLALTGQDSIEFVVEPDGSVVVRKGKMSLAKDRAR